MRLEYPKIETLYDRGPDHFVDESRIRCPEFNQLAHWLVTEKVDGTNIRVALEPEGRLQPASVRQMTEPERAWVGAMIEAEGSVIYRDERETSDSWVISVVNTDLEIISALIRATGVGGVGLHTPDNDPNHSTKWHWRVTRFLDIREIAQQCVSYSQKVRRVLDEPSQVALRADAWTVRIYGRTERAQIPTSLLAHLQDTFNWEKMQNLWRGKNDCPKCHGGGQYDSGEPNFFAREYLGHRAYQCECVEPYPITLYGEGYGARIQKGGGSYRTGVSFRLFDVLVDGKWWLDWASVKDVAEKLGIETVPSLGIAMTGGIVEMVKHGFGSVVALQDGGDKSYLAEGIVARTDPYLYDKHGRPLKFKLKTRDFARSDSIGGR